MHHYQRPPHGPMQWLSDKPNRKTEFIQQNFALRGSVVCGQTQVFDWGALFVQEGWSQVSSISLVGILMQFLVFTKSTS